MLYASFSTLTYFLEIEKLPCSVESGEFSEAQENLGVYSVPGWSFGYYAVDSSWNADVAPNIVKNPEDSILVQVFNLPTSRLHEISQLKMIYSGKYRFDYLDIDTLGEEVLFVSLSAAGNQEKPAISTVLEVVDFAVSVGFEKEYIDNVIIERAELGNKEQNYLFNEEMYSPQANKSCEVIREWLINNK
jgi:hypothetical protein